MKETKSSSLYSRGEFIKLFSRGIGVTALSSVIPGDVLAESPKGAREIEPTSTTFDMREFVHWIVSEYEPSIRLPGGAGRYPSKPGLKEPALYGVSDMACVLYTIGELHPSAKEKEEWAKTFEIFQVAQTGWFLEKPPTLSMQHNTAFALGAMQLLDIVPKYQVKTEPMYENIRSYLGSLNWRTGVYTDSHKGAGVGSIYELVPQLHSTKWFEEYFDTCDKLFDSANGLMGQGKPAGGDIDQIGGTFHYSFLYQFFNRHMPYPESRINTVLGLQRPDGYWSPSNTLWMTLDAIYLMTRTLRYTSHRADDVRASVRHIMKTLHKDVYSAEGRKTVFSSTSGVHSLTAAINIAAEIQQFLGSSEVITDWPLKLVLDRRPFI